VSGGIPAIPLQLSFGDFYFGADWNRRTPRNHAAVGDLAISLAIAPIVVIAPVGISFAAAAHRGIVRLHQPSIPLVQLGVIVVVRANRGRNQHETEES
jgi:hypothetical protein